MRGHIRDLPSRARRRLLACDEAEPIALGVLILGLFVIAALYNGFNYGARLSRPDWRCAADAKGAIACLPVPKARVLQ